MERKKTTPISAFLSPVSFHVVFPLSLNADQLCLECTLHFRCSVYVSTKKISVSETFVDVENVWFGLANATIYT